MITRNIIINQLAEYQNGTNKNIRGLLTLNGECNISGNLKVFNVDEDLLPLSMAIKVGERKYVYQDIVEPQNYSFRIVGAPNDENITILLATTFNNSVVGLAMGHNAGSNQDYSDLFAEITPAELDEIIDNELNQDVENFSQDEQDTLSPPEPQNEIVEEIMPEEIGNFYALIQPQLDELFAKFPHYKELEDLVQNTEWIKVNYSQEGNHYILGKLFDGSVVTHLCYGIPAQSRNIAPPSSLIDFCQWLPLSLEEPDSSGYWVMYQNAETGENIKL
ncbi:MAG: hypothetical protein J6C13_04985 [Clostridia bacterium]|nr:hypothetical protein [Clostridia bacterium]